MKGPGEFPTGEFPPSVNSLPPPPQKKTYIRQD